MISVRLDPDVERRLELLAKRTGRAKSFHARELIEGNLEDLEDRYLAVARLEKRRPAMTSGQLRQQLGVPAEKTAKKRVPGIDKGKIRIAGDFKKLSKCELNDWYRGDSKLITRGPGLTT